MQCHCLHPCNIASCHISKQVPLLKFFVGLVGGSKSHSAHWKSARGKIQNSSCPPVENFLSGLTTGTLRRKMTREYALARSMKADHLLTSKNQWEPAL